MSDEIRNESETQVIPQSEESLTRTLPVDETRELPETVAHTQAIPVDDAPTEAMPADAAPTRTIPQNDPDSAICSGPSAEPDSGTAPRQVPLYSTTPPSSNTAGFASVAPGPAPYVQVPVGTPNERPVIRKTGPSAVTIVFGVLLILIGATALGLGIGFPTTVLSGFGADPRAVVAIVCGIIGGLLILVSVIWAVARIIGSMRHKDDEPRA